MEIVADGSSRDDCICIARLPTQLKDSSMRVQFGVYYPSAARRMLNSTKALAGKASSLTCDVKTYRTLRSSTAWPPLVFSDVFPRTLFRR